MMGSLYTFPRKLFWRRWQPKLNKLSQHVFFDLVQELSDTPHFLHLGTSWRRVKLSKLHQNQNMKKLLRHYLQVVILIWIITKSVLFLHAQPSSQESCNVFKYENYCVFQPFLSLTHSGRMSIYNQHGDCFMDKCRYKIEKVSFVFLQSYVAIGHCILCRHIHECFVCLLLPSGSHYLNFLGNEFHLYITAYYVLVAWFHVQPNLGPLDWRNWDIIPCVMWMKNLVVIC
jgi:hypothetical protein